MLNIDPNAPVLAKKKRLAWLAEISTVIGLLISILALLITSYYAIKTYSLSIETANNKEQLNRLDTLVVRNDSSIKNLIKVTNALNALLSTTNANDTSLKNLVKGSQMEFKSIQQLLNVNSISSQKLADAVKGIIYSDTALFAQTNLLTKSIGINNEILSRNKHDDSARFMNASYELEDLLNKIDTAYGHVFYLSDSLTNIIYIDSTLKLFKLGLKNYCVNDNRDLFTGWRTAIWYLNYFKRLVMSGYPNAEEMKGITGDMFFTQWGDQSLQFKDSGQYLDNLMDDLHTILLDSRKSYENPEYPNKFSIFR